MRDQEKRDPKGRKVVRGAHRSWRGGKRDPAALIKRIQQVQRPDNVEDPDEREGEPALESGERDEGQGRSQKIAIGLVASEHGGRQFRRNDARNQHCEPDIPESVQHKDWPECFWPLPFA